MQQQNNPQKPDSMMDPQQPVHQPAEQHSTDQRDQQIKAEPDTARLRSERQSVIDGEEQRRQNNP